MNSKRVVEKILSSEGVIVGGSNSWDIRILDDRFYDRVLSDGSLGLGESYMDGWWESPAVDQFIFRMVRADSRRKMGISFQLAWSFLLSKLINFQNKSRATEVAERHYNLGNKLYEQFLDPYWQYSCGYFKDTDDLAKAQEQKLDLICRKLQLKPTDHVLDIGCGWGGLAKYMAEHYGCHVTGINLSDEQIKLAREFNKGLPVEILKIDYRDLKGKFDKIVSVGMFEHVGAKNYRQYMRAVHNLLEDDGIFLLHTIGNNITVPVLERWIDKYIFPNGEVPSVKQVASAMTGPVFTKSLFVMEDWHNFGPYYDFTLMAWFKGFDANWDKLKTDYDQRFYRMWKYYLLSCAGTFRARKLQLWQIVMTKKGILAGYQSIR